MIGLGLHIVVRYFTHVDARQIAAGLRLIDEAMIAALSRHTGCDLSLSFDRAASRIPGVRRISST